MWKCVEMEGKTKKKKYKKKEDQGYKWSTKAEEGGYLLQKSK